MEIKECLPFSGVGAERSVEVLVLSVCAMLLCTGVCASVRAAETVRVARIAIVGGVSGVAAAGTSVTRSRTKRISALDRSTEM